MDPEPKNPRPERDRTDEGLRTERKIADEAIDAKLTAVEANADELIERAREQADVVLDAARVKADDELAAAAPGDRDRAALMKGRDLEDEVVHDERVAADEILRRERQEQARALAALRPFEREKTDRYLLTERARSDDDVANRDDFLGMVSHDLRNLLSGIVLHGALLSEQASSSDEGRRTVAGMQHIQRYLARMNRLIGDLVDVVSIDAGKLAVHRERCDVGALVAEAVGSFAPAAAEKGIALESIVAEPPFEADLDHERMLQVLANLTTNALKFTPPGGAITVRAERDGDEVHFAVSDTGIGIPADMLEVVFERFWQVGQNDRRGLGLGLYISKCIVEAHGGRIWAESAPGEGSRIHVTIPGE